MAAAAARAEQLDSIADNLANVETPGFKASRPAFQSFLPRAGAVSDKVAAAAVDTGTNLAPGLRQITDNPLDVVPDDNAFLTVQTSTGPAYTRNGRITLSPDGVLTTAGRMLLGQSGNPIQLPVGATPLINERGAVLVDGVEIDRLALANLQGPVAHLGTSVYGPGPGGTATPAPDTGVATRQIEMANATALDASVQMISSQRQFETAMQAIQTYRRLDDQVIQVGKSR